MARHNEIGVWGENLACEKLVADGCAIVARNWRVRHYEVDIIAIKGSRIIFAEVKTRSNRNADLRQMFSKSKITRIVRSANAYLRIYNVHHAPQFDMFFISGEPHDYKIEHIADAYFPNQKTYK